MTDDEKYLFDLNGYLHLEGVLQGEALKAAQDAAQRYIDTPPDQVPDGFEINLEREHFNWYLHAFAFDKALEALTMHPVTWPIIKELLDEQPRLLGGNMMVDFHGNVFHPLHAAEYLGIQPSVIDGTNVGGSSFVNCVQSAAMGGGRIERRSGHHVQYAPGSRRCRRGRTLATFSVRRRDPR